MEERISEAFTACILGAIISAHISLLEKGTPRFMEKSDSSPVTIYDVVIQNVFANLLGPLGIGLIAEEDARGEMPVEIEKFIKNEACGKMVSECLSKIVGFTDKHGLTHLLVPVSLEECGKVRVVLDPIDGTRGFIGKRHFTIAAGCVVGEKRVFSVIASPKTGVIHYSPSVETCKMLFIPRSMGVPSSLRSFPLGRDLSESIDNFIESRKLRLVLSYHAGHSSTKLDLFLKKIPPLWDVVLDKVDGQDKYIGIARNQYDLYIRIPAQGYREKIWDHLPGAGMVIEAGGVVTDLFGRKIDLTIRGTKEIEGYGIVASMNPRLHEIAVSVIGSFIQEEITDTAPNR
jgi:3'-phosphoadenosine 5'-phosphosulfate (PAPS) 3'-phosphatase